MTKEQLNEFVLLQARIAMKQMIDQYGEYRQQIVIVDLKGEFHIAVLANMTMHGTQWGDIVKKMATRVGGVDAVVLLADTRRKIVDPSEIRKISELAMRGIRTVGDDPTNQEVLLAVGRSHEHVAMCSMDYDRKSSKKGDVITFREKEPRIETHGGLNVSNILPDIWIEPFKVN